MFHLVKGSAYFILRVHQSCDHVYIYCAYLWYIYIYIYIWLCMFYSPTFTCVVSFLSLYTCFFTVCNLLFLFHTKMPWWVLFKVFWKYMMMYVCFLQSIFDIYIYDDVCFLHLPLHVLFLFSLYTCFFMYTIFISVSHMMPWWVLFKCFKKIDCESLSCHELSSCKVFQEFVIGIDFLCNTTSGYEFSDLRLLSWLFVLLWFCYELPKGEIVKDIFYVIGKSFDKMHFTCYWVDLGWV